MKNYLFLIAAILAEVTATSALKASDGFTKLWPSIVTAVGYGIAFYFMSLTIKTIPVGIVYALWSGAGIVLITIVGYYAFGQKLDLPAIAGIGMIIAGVLTINLFSHSTH